MRIVITDTGSVPFKIQKEDIVIRDNGKIQPCRYCDKCWIETPGMCVIPDSLQYVSTLLSKCDELILVGKYEFGWLSPFLSGVLERLKPYQFPEINKDSFSNRYKHTFQMYAYLYNENSTNKERTLLRNNLERWAYAYHSYLKDITFYHDAIGWFSL